MTQGNRVLINTIASYGRSLVALAFGLFSARWVIQGLGKVDFGLYSLVGATIAFVTTINAILSGSVARYYAYELGMGMNKDLVQSQNTTCGWFNTALLLHVILAFVVFVIGYPVGLVAVKYWLVIPPERISACLWVFSLAMASSIMSVISAPYIAMFIATQNILETSIWGVVSVFCTCGSAYSVLNYNGDRMCLYSTLLVGSSMIISLLMVLRARFRFKECRIVGAELFDRKRIFSLLGFAGWQTYAAMGDMVRSQGNAFVINLGWGPTINASYAISNQVSGHASALSTALQNAMTPAITLKAGARDKSALMLYADASNKIGALLIAVFAVPLILEIDYVLRLWLGDVPEYAGVLCAATLVTLFIDKLAMGNVMAIIANGQVGTYQFVSGTLSILSIVFVYLGVKIGATPIVIGLSFIILNVLKTVARLYFSKKLLEMSILRWLSNVLLPISFTCSVTICSCSIVRMSFGIEVSFLRTFLLSLCSLFTFTVVSWWIVLNDVERKLIRNIGDNFRRKLLK